MELILIFNDARPGWELPDARETNGKRTLSG